MPYLRKHALIIAWENRYFVQCPSILGASPPQIVIIFGVPVEGAVLEQKNEGFLGRFRR